MCHFIKTAGMCTLSQWIITTLGLTKWNKGRNYNVMAKTHSAVFTEIHSIDCTEELKYYFINRIKCEMKDTGLKEKNKESEHLYTRHILCYIGKCILGKRFIMYCMCIISMKISAPGYWENMIMIMSVCEWVRKVKSARHWKSYGKESGDEYMIK